MSDQAQLVLVIEDSDTKWRDVERQLLSMELPNLRLQRAATMDEANRKISEGVWNLILLDVSMDITASSAGRRAGGHATTGGLRIAERMFYLEKDAPIIIVTAFDAFTPADGKRGAVLGLEDVVRDASDLLGDLLVGYVRYGDNGWEERLTGLVRKVLRD